MCSLYKIELMYLVRLIIVSIRILHSSTTAKNLQSLKYTQPPPSGQINPTYGDPISTCSSPTQCFSTLFSPSR